MTVIDVERLLQDVSPEQPCGSDLEYDPGYADMERAAQPKPPPEFEPDKAPEPANWREVRKKTEELLSRSKDLRIAVYLTRALMHTEGVTGFTEGVALLRGLMENYWDTVHPMLDVEDNNDPTMRINSLLQLCDGDGLLKELSEVPLVSSRVIGSFSLRDIQVASGKSLLSPGAEQADPALIDAAFMECDLDELEATRQSVVQSLDHSRAIDSFLTERVGAAQAPNLSGLTDLLSDMLAALNERLARRGIDHGGEQPSGPGAEGGEAGAAGGSAAINSREDVVRALERICDWYSREEPSSPVPLLLTRAKRLVSKSFLEILRDMTPDGVSQAETIGGVDRNE